MKKTKDCGKKKLNNKNYDYIINNSIRKRF